MVHGAYLKLTLDKIDNGKGFVNKKMMQNFTVTFQKLRMPQLLGVEGGLRLSSAEVKL